MSAMPLIPQVCTGSPDIDRALQQFVDTVVMEGYAVNAWRSESRRSQIIEFPNVDLFAEIPDEVLIERDFDKIDEILCEVMRLARLKRPLMENLETREERQFASELMMSSGVLE